MTITTDPAALPLFADPPSRPGRVRGGFSMSPQAGPDTRPTPVVSPERVRRPEGEVDDIDWALVRELRTTVATRLTDTWGTGWSGDSGANATIGRAEQEAFGRQVIGEVLREHVADLVATGAEDAWSPTQLDRMTAAVFDAVFRLGRLQPLIDNDQVENIFILGYDRVLLQLVDGSRRAAPPVADSDDELIDFLRYLANRSESNPRPFSEGTPKLHLKLDGGARLAATAWVVSRPAVVIRRHRLVIDDLAGWVQRGCMTTACASFLSAAVRAGWSVVVAGPMSAGKTTLMRALCAEIPSGDALGTFETEYELFLNEAGRHDVVIDWESRPGMGEVGLDGRAAGAFDLDEALTDSFRFALDRQIVGEIRGREVWTMIKAMESGTGSLSTTHAASAEACVRKLVTCAMEAGSHVSRDLALEKLAGCLDVIVQLKRRVVPTADGRTQLLRWVSEVVLVEPGEREVGYALTHAFGPSNAGPAQASGVLSSRCQELAAYGFDQSGYGREADGKGWSS